MQHSGMTLEEIKRTLLNEAGRLWGKERAAALHADLEQTADELWKVYHYPLGLEDEP